MKYGKEKTKEICECLEKGLGRVDSCVLVDISYDTFTQWMKKSEFSEAIKKAETKNKKEYIEVIKKASKKTWQAGAWWLERRHRDEFALRQEREYSGELKIKIVNYGNNNTSSLRTKKLSASDSGEPSKIQSDSNAQEVRKDKDNSKSADNKSASKERDVSVSFTDLQAGKKSSMAGSRDDETHTNSDNRKEE